MKIDIAKAKLAKKFGNKNAINYAHLLIDKINDKTQKRYHPREYDGCINLFKPKTHYAGYKDPYFGWGDCAKKGVIVDELPLNPRGSLNEPFVRLLAERVSLEVKSAIHNTAN